VRWGVGSARFRIEPREVAPSFAEPTYQSTNLARGYHWIEHTFASALIVVNFFANLIDQDPGLRILDAQVVEEYLAAHQSLADVIDPFRVEWKLARA